MSAFEEGIADCKRLTNRQSRRSTMVTHNYVTVTLKLQNDHSVRKPEGNVATNLMVKVKLSLCLTKHHAMKTYWGSEDIAPLIL